MLIVNSSIVAEFTPLIERYVQLLISQTIILIWRLLLALQWKQSCLRWGKYTTKTYRMDQIQPSYHVQVLSQCPVYNPFWQICNIGTQLHTSSRRSAISTYVLLHKNSSVLILSSPGDQTRHIPLMRLILSISSLRLLYSYYCPPYAIVYLAHPSLGIFNYMLSLFEFLNSPVLASHNIPYRI